MTQYGEYTENELIDWLEKNPYRPFVDYRDELTDKQAQMILDGKVEELEDEIFASFIFMDWQSCHKDKFFTILILRVKS